MRQFIASENPDKKGLIQVSGKDYRYFKQVLRLTAGDMLAVRVPDGRLVNTTVAKVDENKKIITLQLCDVVAGDSDASGENQSQYSAETDFYLFQFAAKGSKMDLIVRQAAECGIKKIIPVLGDYSQSSGAEKNFRNDRYERIIKEARQQSGSPVCTEISGAITVDQACSLWREIAAEKGSHKAFACVLYERSEKTKSLHEALSGFDEIKACAVFCGAEGGISPDEIDRFCAQGIIPVHFETNILRCETAALYGTACVQNAVTEKKIWQK